MALSKSLKARKRSSSLWRSMLIVMIHPNAFCSKPECQMSGPFRDEGDRQNSCTPDRASRPSIARGEPLLRHECDARLRSAEGSLFSLDNSLSWLSRLLPLKDQTATTYPKRAHPIFNTQRSSSPFVLDTDTSKELSCRRERTVTSRSPAPVISLAKQPAASPSPPTKVILDVAIPTE